MAFLLSLVPHRVGRLALLALVLASGCRGKSTADSDRGSGTPGDGDLGDGDSGDGDGDSGDGDSGEPPITDTPFALDDAGELFDAAAVPVFAVTMDEEDWDFLNADPAREEYVEGQLSYNGTEIGPVGLRYKGSYGSLLGCLDERGRLDGCNKLSFKMKFSEVDRNMRFFKMKRLNFHAMARDASKLHDKIAYQVYRDAGIVAPRSTWARLEVNGESLGLFALVEQIDGRFTADRWPDGGDGNLFKEVWPISDELDTYVEGLKTNEEAAEGDTYLRFREELYAAAPAEALGVVESWMDAEQLYTYAAVNDAIGNWDGITAFYCSEFGCANHNFYMYQHEEEERFTMIPWDLDATLSATTPFDLLPHWTAEADCEQRYSMFNGFIDAMAPGCDRLLGALATQRQRYSEAMDAILAGPFDVEEILTRIDDYVALIRDEIATDPTLEGEDAWLLEVDRLKSELPLLKLRAEAYRDGTAIEPLSIRTQAVLDFEAASQLEFVMGTNLWASPGSSAALSLSAEGALGGAQDARIDFTYRDNGEPWSQWIGWWFVVSPAEKDWSSHSGIRLTLAADPERDVRIDLESPHQPGGADGASLGWDLTVGTTPATVELLFEDAAIPVWAMSQGEQLGEVLTQVTQVRINPTAIRDVDGLIGDGEEDSGFLRVDDVEVF